MTEKKTAAGTIPAAKEEKVLVHLRYDDRHKRPLSVTLNGVETKIPRGVDTYVTKAVKEVIDNAIKQEDESERYQDMMSGSFKA